MRLLSFLIIGLINLNICMAQDVDPTQAEITREQRRQAMELLDPAYAEAYIQAIHNKAAVAGAEAEVKAAEGFYKAKYDLMAQYSLTGISEDIKDEQARRARLRAQEERNANLNDNLDRQGTAAYQSQIAAALGLQKMQRLNAQMQQERIARSTELQAARQAQSINFANLCTTVYAYLDPACGVRAADAVVRGMGARDTAANRVREQQTVQGNAGIFAPVNIGLAAQAADDYNPLVAQ